MLMLLSVCLIAEPSRCYEERIPVSYENPNPFVCLRNSQATLAKWQGDHPDWTIKKWRCAAKDNLPADL